MKKFEKVFITGGAGYVGSLLVPNLLNNGYKVIVYDLNIYEYKFQPHKNLKQIKGDIRDKNKLNIDSKGCDVMIHLASISNDPSFDLNPRLGKSINYESIFNIIDSCEINRIKRLIVASSTSQYGIKPLSEEVTENTIPEPITDYAKFKHLCEVEIKSKERTFEYVFVRPATLCGYAPRLRLDLSINILTLNGLVNEKIKVFGGTQMRPALNIRDMVRFYELMLTAETHLINHKAFNVSYDNKTIQELAVQVKKTINNKKVIISKELSNDSRSYHVNADKIKNELKFECKYNFNDAINSIISNYELGILIDPLNNELYHNVKRMKNIKLK